MFKLTKLDRRHTGYPFLKYYVLPSYTWATSKEDRIERFLELRQWCWDTFGPGVELKYVNLHPTSEGLESTTKWAWNTEEEHLRIYFKSDEELAFYKLKWQ